MRLSEKFAEGSSALLRPISRCWPLLGGVLLSTFVASVWPRSEDSSAFESGGPFMQADTLKLKMDLTLIGELRLPVLEEQLERRRGAANVADIFAPEVPTAVASRPATYAPPAPAPLAPPFPYAITGTFVDSNVAAVMFEKQDQYFTLKAGDTLENAYRVDAIAPRQITVTYLPLGLQQILPLGASD